MWKANLLKHMADKNFDYEENLLACARGDYAALAKIYEQEASWLLGVALRIVRRKELAHEVLHDAFIQIWLKSSGYQPTLGSARGWIYSVVRHRAIHILRAGAHEIREPDSQVDARASEDPGPADVFAEKRNAQALHRCLDVLDEQKRHCILLAYVDGYTHAEIASRLGHPLGTVKAWMRRGLLLLRECLS
ncbi:MAG TPA: sigma-70 family RNA polymerase sigma factor [Noviherbaspirillum sp.]|jgi:RNA polymerase sigma-70 factor (ECF subfamily)|uniref:sigma-70 family RNA polymerase sigma factor n=1 Tax=Noviherbaspirillum sp. TaxID=1926288 RepID=UPI002F9593BB